ncbi:hypothetical protein ACB094_08G006700 [Castanea mollissima]
MRGGESIWGSERWKVLCMERGKRWWWWELLWLREGVGWKGIFYNQVKYSHHKGTFCILQNLFLYGYAAMFNFLAILGIAIFKGPGSLDILQGHSKATMLLICNNAAQGILSSFFFKYADTILKKYSSTVATIFTGIASAALFGHTLTINFILGISIVFISMHQFFSPLSMIKDKPQNGNFEMIDNQNNQRRTC